MSKKHKRDARPVTCPYCNGVAELVGGEVIYPHRPDLEAKKFWNCAPCHAYVGTHPGTTNPLGRLADKELREAKQKAHAAFDPLWRRGQQHRNTAYAWLAEKMGKQEGKCHIGWMDVADCRRVVAICTRSNA